MRICSLASQSVRDEGGPLSVAHFLTAQTQFLLERIVRDKVRSLPCCACTRWQVCVAACCCLCAGCMQHAWQAPQAVLLSIPSTGSLHLAARPLRQSLHALYSSACTCACLAASAAVQHKGVSLTRAGQTIRCRRAAVFRPFSSARTHHTYVHTCAHRSRSTARPSLTLWQLHLQTMWALLNINEASC